jgi:hypothetical protein
MARLFADTSYGKVRALTSDPDGNVIGEFFFEPPSKVQTGEHRELFFKGYLGDPEILGQARRDAVATMTVRERFARWWSNVSLLFVRNDLWPEHTHLPPDRPGRIIYIDLCKAILLALLVPLTLVGLRAGAEKPTPVVVVAGAHVLTAIVTAGFFYGEARYRVPYDMFFFLLALEGARQLVPELARRLTEAAPRDVPSG